MKPISDAIQTFSRSVYEATCKVPDKIDLPFDAFCQLALEVGVSLLGVRWAFYVETGNGEVLIECCAAPGSSFR